MSALRALLVLAVALSFQVALGRLVSSGHRYVDVLLVPVVLYGVASSQRSAMLMGCAAGLLSDTWFFGGPFGMTGFKWTALGWALGALAGWIDLNRPSGRVATGVALVAGDALLDVLLRGLIEAGPRAPGAIELPVKALCTGLLAAAAGSILRWGGRPPRPAANA
jgi:cell shape-determining protein MreD